jgi:7-keto-8-aminopelargonate synthetase-like enzyme
VFRHNDLDNLAEILKWADARRNSAGRRPRVLIVTESIFSMDGDRAPLKEIVALKERTGAWLMVDEAHAGGILGAKGGGLIEELGLGKQVEVQMGTLGKALGSSGGYICGSRLLIETLVNRARSFIFSTAPVPAAAAAAAAAIQFAQSEAGLSRRKTLWENVRAAQGCLEKLLPAKAAGQSPIFPIILGGEEKAAESARALREQGIYAPAIRYPTVARGKARLRVTVTAGHAQEQIERLSGALRM